MPEIAPEMIPLNNPESATRHFLSGVARELGDVGGAIGLSELATQVMFGVVENITKSPIDPITKNYFRGGALITGAYLSRGGLKPASIIESIISKFKQRK